MTPTSLIPTLQPYPHIKDTHTSAYLCCLNSTHPSEHLLPSCLCNEQARLMPRDIEPYPHHHPSSAFGNMKARPRKHSIARNTHMDGVKERREIIWSGRHMNLTTAFSVDVCYCFKYLGRFLCIFGLVPFSLIFLSNFWRFAIVTLGAPQGSLLYLAIFFFSHRRLTYRLWASRFPSDIGNSTFGK